MIKKSLLIVLVYTALFLVGCGEKMLLEYDDIMDFDIQEFDANGKKATENI